MAASETHKTIRGQGGSRVIRGERMPEKKERYQNRIELLQGTLDLLILQTLQWGPQHGYGISVAIRNRSGEILQVDTGSLYPALHRLEKQKWIEAEWRVSENKQRAKYYQLTAAGKKQLTCERTKWSQLSDAMAGVLNPEQM
jgi:PadR family transcriptional regulator, regulatory protein PadR